MLIGRNFDFLGGYLVVTARYLVVTARYCSLLRGYCSLLVGTAHYRSLLLVPTLSMNALKTLNYRGRVILASTFPDDIIFLEGLLF